MNLNFVERRVLKSTFLYCNLAVVTMFVVQAMLLWAMGGMHYQSINHLVLNNDTETAFLKQAYYLTSASVAEMAATASACVATLIAIATFLSRSFLVHAAIISVCSVSLLFMPLDRMYFRYMLSESMQPIASIVFNRVGLHSLHAFDYRYFVAASVAIGVCYLLHNKWSHRNAG